MATCPECRETFDEDTKTCPHHGVELLPDAAFAAADVDLRAGDKVGEYEVICKIGEGGFGTVFRGVQPLIGKNVAIKVLKRQFSSDPQMASRFISEARAVNQIGHRYIIDIFSFGQLDDGRHYLVMDLLQGQPLDELLKSIGGRLALDRSVPILRAVAEAVDAAHAASILHRDLKPENVFVCKGGEIKLLDFGIAKLTGDDVGHKTKTGSPMGTATYMSPEQARGREVDHRTDIYAFGVMTFQMVTGQVPFGGDDFMDILIKQISEAPPRPSAVVADVAEVLDEPILRMLSKEPAERPNSLTEAITALADAVSRSGVSVPSTMPEITAVIPIVDLADPKSATMPAASSSTTSALLASESVSRSAADPSAGKSKLGLFAGGVVVALAAAAAAFFLLGGGGNGQDEPRSTKSNSQSVTAPGATAPETPTPPAAVVADAAPEPPTAILVAIEGGPAKFAVYGEDGEALGVAPGTIELPYGDTPIELTFRKRGYKSETKMVTPNAPAALLVELTKKPKKSKKKKPKKKPGLDDIEEAF